MGFPSGPGTVDVDLGFERIQREMERANNAQVSVGIFAGATSFDGQSIAVYATANEFGYPEGSGREGRPPERSFMRSTVDRNRRLYNQQIERGLARIHDGQATTVQVLNELGLKVQGDFKQAITDLREPPNAPSTIEAKGSSNPLIDTGAMRNAVTFEVDAR